MTKFTFWLGLAAPCLLALLQMNFVNLATSQTLAMHNQTNHVETRATHDTTATRNDVHKVQCETNLYKITGKIHFLPNDDQITIRNSLMKARILINHGQFVAYPKDDGSFEVENLPSESYVVEITHPKYIYEPYRVDITSKGKIRARRVNYIQPALVQTVDYPLIFRPKSLHNYFVPRETWRVMDLIFNPMIMMMFVPLIIIWLLPKMMNPQEVQAQRDSMQMPEYNVPELSEMMASMFGRQPGAVGTQAIGAGSSGSGGGSGNSRSNKARRK